MIKKLRNPVIVNHVFEKERSGISYLVTNPGQENEQLWEPDSNLEQSMAAFSYWKDINNMIDIDPSNKVEIKNFYFSGDEKLYFAKIDGKLHFIPSDLATKSQACISIIDYYMGLNNL